MTELAGSYQKACDRFIAQAERLLSGKDLSHESLRLLAISIAADFPEFPPHLLASGLIAQFEKQRSKEGSMS